LGDSADNESPSVAGESGVISDEGAKEGNNSGKN
jgi:hypothetical protein